MQQIGLDAVLNNVPDFTAGINKMNASVDSFAQNSTNQGNAFAGGFGDVVTGALRSVAAVAAGVGVAAFLALGKAIVTGVGDAREANMLLGQTNAVITSTGGAAERSAVQITDLATALSASQGASLFGDSAVQAAENLLLTFTNIKGEVFDTATAISLDMAQALGGEPKDQAIALGKALNDPIAGVTALTRVGVTFTDQQKDQIRTMQEAGDMAGAQQVILAELNKEFGGSAKAAAVADGGWAQITDTLGELGESVGAAVLPILGELADWLNSPAVKQGAADFADGLIVGFGWIHDHIPPIVDIVLGVFDDLQGSLNENAGFFESSFASIKNIVTDVVSIVQIALAALASFIDEHGATIQRILGNAWSSIQAVIDIALALIEGVVKTTLALLQGDWQGAWTAIQDMSARVVTDLWTIISGGLDNLLGLFQDLTGNVQESWDTMISDALIAGGELVAGIQEGVRDAWSGFTSWIIDLATGMIDEFLEAWGIKSPATEWMPAGHFAVEGIMAGFQSMWPKLIDLVSGLGEDLVDQAADIGRSVQDAIADAFGATASIDRQKIKNLEQFADVAERLKGGVQFQLQDAEKVAQGITDPKQAAAWFKQRSDQIFELADITSKLDRDLTDQQARGFESSLKQYELDLAALGKEDEDTTQEAAQREHIMTRMAEAQARLNDDLTDSARQMLIDKYQLVNAAQLAETAQLSATQAQGSDTQKLMDEIQAFLLANNKALPGILESPVINSLNTLLGQMVSPPSTRPPSSGSSSTSIGHQGNILNMPIYSNNSANMIQDSMAIAAAALL